MQLLCHSVNSIMWPIHQNITKSLCSMVNNHLFCSLETSEKWYAIHCLKLHLCSHFMHKTTAEFHNSNCKMMLPHAHQIFLMRSFYPSHRDKYATFIRQPYSVSLDEHIIVDGNLQVLSQQR